MIAKDKVIGCVGVVYITPQVLCPMVRPVVPGSIPHVVRGKLFANSQRSTWWGLILVALFKWKVRAGRDWGGVVAPELVPIVNQDFCVLRYLSLARD